MGERVGVADPLIAGGGVEGLKKRIQVLVVALESLLAHRLQTAHQGHLNPELYTLFPCKAPQEGSAVPWHSVEAPASVRRQGTRGHCSWGPLYTFTLRLLWNQRRL